jgi:hypothetical protein
MTTTFDPDKAAQEAMQDNMLPPPSNPMAVV